MNKRRRILKKLKKSILKDITKIQVRIHRIGLSGKYYKWVDLEEEIGKLKLNDAYRPNERRKNYGTQAFGRFMNRKITVFLNPTEPYIPQCLIEMSYPNVKFLSKLRSKLPDLKVSFAEYTIDLFFKNSDDVKKYFALIYRYIYFPYRKEMVLQLDKKLGDKTRDKNAWVYVDEDRMKLYERGPDDEIEKGGYWLLENVDRIRIEFRAEWKDLDKHDLVSLKSFSQNPQFDIMMRDKFRFKRFKKSVNNNLPTEYDEYSVKDLKGHSGAFQNEFLYLKKRKAVKNISQSIEDVPELKPLYARILYRIITREEKWEKKYRQVNRKELAKIEKVEKKTGWTMLSLEEAKKLQREILKSLKKDS